MIRAFGVEDEVLALAAAAEQGSEHRSAKRSWRARARPGTAPISEFTTVPGRGIDAMAPDGRVLLGNLS